MNKAKIERKKLIKMQNFLKDKKKGKAAYIAEKNRDVTETKPGRIEY